MADFSFKAGRKLIFWSDHSLDRWWERCAENGLLGRAAAKRLLEERLCDKKIDRTLPAWAQVNKFHRARAEGFLYIDSGSGFVVNRNANGDYVAVTYIENDQVFA